jgi:hypothetical protein
MIWDMYARLLLKRNSVYKDNSARANSEAEAKAVASNKMTRMTRRITDPSVSISETEISDAVEI